MCMMNSAFISQSLIINYGLLGIESVYTQCNQTDTKTIHTHDERLFMRRVYDKFHRLILLQLLYLMGDVLYQYFGFDKNRCIINGEWRQFFPYFCVEDLSFQHLILWTQIYELCIYGCRQI